MLCLSTLVVLFFSAYAAGPVDKNCTENDGTDDLYTTASVSCSNVYTDAACTALFGPDVTAASSTERPTNCFSDGTNPNEEVKTIAVANCPKTCGYCCESAEYDCSNVDFPRVRCETVTKAMCLDSIWRQVLSEDCPNVCGFCLLGSCIDKAVDCENDISICRQINMTAFVQENCQRTCDYCTSTTSTNTTCATATDSSSYCAQWNLRGFCASSFYTTAIKQQYCAKTCC